MLLRAYFFFDLGSVVLAAGFFTFAVVAAAGFFDAAAGFLLLVDDVARAAAGFFSFGDVAAFSAGFFSINSRAALGRGSVLRRAIAGVSSLVSGAGVSLGAGGTACGVEASCLAASCQLGKNNSIRWREIELARRQRGQCAS